jgi:hypothetical protein
MSLADDVSDFIKLCEEVGLETNIGFYTHEELLGYSADYNEGLLSRMRLIKDQFWKLANETAKEVLNEKNELIKRMDLIKQTLGNTSLAISPYNIQQTQHETLQNKERLSDFLKNHNRRTAIPNDSCPATKQLALRYEHYLFKYQSQIIDLAGGGDISFQRLINEPRYLDAIIKEKPDAVLVRGFLFMLAQCVHHQKVEPGLLMKFLSVTNLLDEEDKKFLAKRAFVTSSAADMNEKVDMMVDWLKEFGGQTQFIDAHSRGFHMNYLRLPAFDLNPVFIIDYSTDLHGKVYTKVQAKEFLSSLDSKPYLAVDFGYKRIIAPNELIFENQYNVGSFSHEAFAIGMFDYKIDDSEQLSLPKSTP